MAKITTLEIKSGGLVNQFATEGDNFVYQTKQDVRPIIEHCQVLSEQTPGKEMRHVAEIPMVVYQKAMREGWINDKAKMKRWLNDPDNKAFRTWQGKI